MTPRSLSIAILACAGWTAASDARALGVGRIPESIAFGQALDLVVPLRLDAGESLTAACVRADVHLGALRLPSDALQLTLERRGPGGGDTLLRLRSTRVVQEPLVAVNLALGCGASVSRQFVVLADPLAVAPPEPAPRASAGTEHGAAAPTAVRKPVAAAQGAVAPHRVQPAALRLPHPEPETLLKAATLAVAAQDAALASAAQAASAAEAAAAAAELRLAALDTNLKTTRDEAAAQQAVMEQMRRRLAQTEDRGRTQSLLVAIAAALMLLALGLGWRVRTLQRERRALQRQGAAALEAAAAPPVAAAEPAPPPMQVPAPLAALPADPTAAAAPPSAAAIEDALTRPVSVDELIDLEQQAEFFLVLGEESAAVDLLMSHLRGSGGSSPLPYLKLLEIFRRRGDRDAYERMRRRFGQRFNAVAPDWDADPEQGMQLQDYPAVLGALQAAWPRPLDAMAELENLLFRKRKGELFELPAYRDVLTLYAVARDLHRQIDRPGSDVDVLLPLAGSDGAASSIFDGLGAAEDRPTAPVDLDLSEPPAHSRADEARPLRAVSR